MSTDPENTKLKAPADFDGPGKHRRCTDIPCCLLLIASWIAMTAVGMVVCGLIESDELPKGNPARLINGMDYMGNICGVTSNICGTGSLGVSGDDCSSEPNATHTHTYGIKARSKAYYLPSGTAVCVKSCPGSNEYDKFICEYDYQAELDGYLDDGDNAQYIAKGWEYVADNVSSSSYTYACMRASELLTAAHTLSRSSTRAWDDDHNVNRGGAVCCLPISNRHAWSRLKQPNISATAFQTMQLT